MRDGEYLREVDVCDFEMRTGSSMIIMRFRNYSERKYRIVLTKSMFALRSHPALHAL